MHQLAGPYPDHHGQTPLFSMRRLCFTYPDGTPGLRDINLDIHAGDRIALVGLNGSGKSTLIRHLNGLLTAQEGECRYRNQELAPEGLVEMRQRVGILFQDPDDHLFCTTLYEDVAFGPRNQGRTESAVDRLVRDNLAALGLKDLLHKPAHHLSYGQKKRAALAAILAMEPEVLILDEPAANLDPRQERVFRDLLADYRGTLIIIEHNLLFLYGLCDRAVVLAAGRVHHDFRFLDLVSAAAALKEHGLDFSFRFACCGHADGHAEGHRHHHHTHEHGTGAAHARVSSIAKQPLIELQHYSYRYPDGTPGLGDINLCLFAGETVALIGENGAGKSTLAACLVGLRQGEGFFLLDGHPVNTDRLATLWRRVGMVFQHSADQLFCPTCWEEVAFGPERLGLAKAEIEHRTREALALVRLEGYEQRVPLHMSGGERKRLAIASALSLRPQLLILDEPTAGLDPRSQEMLLEILDHLAMAKLLITHDFEFIRRLSSRTVVVHRGGIIRDYATTAFLGDDHLQKVNGLDYTYATACLEQIQQLQWRKEAER